jgi:3-oxoacyl-[acyl-carrier-protein] synthase-3
MSAEQVSVGILGIGSYLPPTVRTNDFWPDGFVESIEKKKKADFLAIDKSSQGESTVIPPEIKEAMAQLRGDPFFGARRRHVISDEAETSDMEAEAALRAMRSAKVRPDEIDLVMVHSLVPDRLMPSNAPALQAKCELVNAAAWSLDVSCASMQAQLVTAAALIRSRVYRKILLVQSQAASRVLDYSTPGSTALGDAAAAVVVGETPPGTGLLGHWMRTDGSLRDGVVFATIIDGQPHRRWDKLGGPTCFASFDVDVGKRAGLRSTEFCREACQGALADAGLNLDDVALYVGNQSLGWLVDACRRGLGLPPERAIDTFAEVANIGAVAILFNLERAWRSGRLKAGDVTLLYSPGAGFTRAAVVYRWVEPNTAP